VRQLSARGGTLIDNLAAIDILTINKSEAGVLVPGLVARYGDNGPAIAATAGEQLPTLAVRGLTGGGFEMRLTSFFGAVRSMGTKYVLVTDGQAGAYLGTGDDILHCPAVRAKVAGTAGAGDSFAAAFITFLALKRPLEDALRAAALNAAAVVAHVDTQTGLLHKADMEARLAGHAANLGIRRWPM
jgi:sugar/nucleoside kinase (ribokinase family)